VNKTYQTLSTRQHQSKKRAFYAPENLECQLPVNQKQATSDTKPNTVQSLTSSLLLKHG
jgi:hypothetical protein